jgi:hypothetical protein
MRKFKMILPAMLAIAACNNNPAATSAETTNTDTTKAASTMVSGDTTTQPEYDPAKDGLLVGAQFARKLADTLNVKMYELTMKPGDTATLHSHPDHAVYVVQGGKLAVYFGGTNRVVMDLPTGGALLSGPVSDAAKNIGKTTIKLVIVDMYRPRGNKNINAK